MCIMKKAALAVCLAFAGAGAVYAKPVTLICKGTLNLDGKPSDIDGETAILDLEKRSFKPPLYVDFPLIRVGETDVTFGSELPTLSTWGSLDRVSGTLSMNVMRPTDRQSLGAGSSARFLAFMSARCMPAARLF
jgi:hypothetical protein